MLAGGGTTRTLLEFATRQRCGNDAATMERTPGVWSTDTRCAVNDDDGREPRGNDVGDDGRRRRDNDNDGTMRSGGPMIT